VLLYFNPPEAAKSAINTADRDLALVFFQRYSFNESRADLTPFLEKIQKYKKKHEVIFQSVGGEPAAINTADRVLISFWKT